MIGAEDVSAFRSDGFVVLRGAFEAERLTHEADDALADGYRGAPLNIGNAANRLAPAPISNRWMVATVPFGCCRDPIERYRSIHRAVYRRKVRSAGTPSKPNRAT